jgi:hypothetical protein
MEVKTERKNKEKEIVKNDVKVLGMMTEDFDPELYIKEKKEEDEYESD